VSIGIGLTSRLPAPVCIVVALVAAVAVDAVVALGVRLGRLRR
jgi:hypothetical protein